MLRTVAHCERSSLAHHIIIPLSVSNDNNSVCVFMNNSLAELGWQSIVSNYTGGVFHKAELGSVTMMMTVCAFMNTSLA